MPAAMVHALHGERVWKWLESESGIVKGPLVKDAFEWGKQGPDFLFCHRFFPWQKGESLEEFGGRLHGEPPENTLNVLKRIWQERAEPAAQSYILGFLCHYSLDCTCHPYIEFLSRKLLEEEPGQTEDVFHNEIESALDGIILRWETGKLPGEFRLESCFPKNEEAETAIVGIYETLFEELFHVSQKELLLAQAEKDARLTFRILNDRSGLKKQVTERLERGKARTISCHIRGITENGEVDYANTEKNEWTDRQGISHTEDFFQLFESAVEVAKKIIVRFPLDSGEVLANGRYF